MSDVAQVFIEDMSVGQSASVTKTVTERDVEQFAEVSTDVNPVHLDAEYAATTMFKTRIAHGMFSAGLISAVLGTKLPGMGTIYLSQTLKFRAPVRIGDTVVATATITDINAEKKRVTFETKAAVGDTVVVEGEAVTLAPSRG